MKNAAGAWTVAFRRNPGRDQKIAHLRIVLGATLE
jgi:hypothetical protein